MLDSLVLEPVLRNPSRSSFICVARCPVAVSERSHILGVELGSSLSFDEDVGEVVGACNYYLCSLRYVRCSVTRSIASTLACSSPDRCYWLLQCAVWTFSTEHSTRQWIYHIACIYSMHLDESSSASKASGNYDSDNLFDASVKRASLASHPQPRWIEGLCYKSYHNDIKLPCVESLQPYSPSRMLRSSNKDQLTTSSGRRGWS